jgi:hypothetical protein
LGAGSSPADCTLLREAGQASLFLYQYIDIESKYVCRL